MEKRERATEIQLVSGWKRRKSNRNEIISEQRKGGMRNRNGVGEWHGEGGTAIEKEIVSEQRSGWKKNRN